MILAHMSWPEVDALDREIVVVIPTGALEQHGPHLPLFTDSLLCTSVCQEVEKRSPDHILLTPTLWLGASAHHLAFSGTLSASFETYMSAIRDVVESLIPHGFAKFYVVNGHGGNTEPNGVILRQLKREYGDILFGHQDYFKPAIGMIAKQMEGPSKEIHHSCEAEVSLMMHLHPHLVRKDKLRDDGLWPVPAITGMVHSYDEQTEEGSKGYATLATPEKGKKIFDAAVEGIAKDLEILYEGYTLVARPRG